MGNMKAVDGKGVKARVAALVLLRARGWVWNAIATVIISWLIDPAEMEGALLFFFRDSGSGESRAPGVRCVWVCSQCSQFSYI